MELMEGMRLMEIMELMEGMELKGLVLFFCWTYL